VNIRAKNILLAAVMACGSIGLVHAQQAPASKAKAAPRTAQGAPATPAPAAPPAAAEQPAAPAAAAAPPPGWAVRCASASREAPLECAMEQNAVLSKTGQTVVSVNIRVPSDTHTPEILVQLPLGFSLPGGARFQVDDGKATEMELRTCENRGCYASATLAPDVVAALKAGKQMKVSFQTLNKEAINIPLPLTDFATAYDKIK
jgi:invasion protein IalB